MFHWLKRRLVREHVKLLIQNDYACEVMGDGWYNEDREISHWLKRQGAIISGLLDLFDKKAGLEANVAEYQLNLNKELRRLHDAGPVKIGESFDIAYTPRSGWRETNNEFLDLE